MAEKSIDKRNYDNRSREELAKETRQNILLALAHQLIKNDKPDFSIDEAAQDAGVTKRTIFRHFPNKESMLAGLSEQVLKTTQSIEIPVDSEGFRETLRSSYQMFEENSDLMRALLLSELGQGIRSQLRERRRIGNANALNQLVEHLSTHDQASIKAILGHLISAESWWQLKSVFNLPTEQSAPALDWLIKLVFEAIKNGDYPSKDH